MRNLHRPDSPWTKALDWILEDEVLEQGEPMTPMGFASTGGPIGITERQPTPALAIQLLGKDGHPQRATFQRWCAKAPVLDSSMRARL
jgi:hypothetical protein